MNESADSAVFAVLLVLAELRARQKKSRTSDGLRSPSRLKKPRGKERRNVRLRADADDLGKFGALSDGTGKTCNAMHKTDSRRKRLGKFLQALIIKSRYATSMLELVLKLLLKASIVEVRS